MNMEIALTLVILVLIWALFYWNTFHKKNPTGDEREGVYEDSPNTKFEKAVLEEVSMRLVEKSEDYLTVEESEYLKIIEELSYMVQKKDALLIEISEHLLKSDALFRKANPDYYRLSKQTEFKKNTAKWDAHSAPARRIILPND